MEHTYRPHLSRETRLLLTTAALALVTLWLLARLRFPDSPTSPNPVTPLLTQITPRVAFDDLAGTIARAQDELAAPLEPLDQSLALRVGNGRALAWLPAPGDDSSRVRAFEEWSGLAVIDATAGNLPPGWTPADPSRPRYLIAADASGGLVAFRPVYVGTMTSATSLVSDRAVWAIPATTDVAPGTFLFSLERQLVGLVLRDDSALIVIPGATLPALADRVVSGAGAATVDLGIHVQGLGGRLAAAVGADRGVVVTHVASDRQADVPIAAGDVIEAIDGRPVSSPEQWVALTARVPAGASLTLRVRQGEVVREFPVVAPAATPQRDRPLGLALRARGRLGVEVLRVEPGSAGAAAGLREGDVLTRFADTAPPGPADVRRLFAGTQAGTPLLVAVTRGATHLVTTLEK